MEKYTIYCTESQVKKALELGAPITLFSNSGYIPQETADNWHLCLLSENAYIIPTVEQMLGWLETKDVYIDTKRSDDGFDIWYYYTINEIYGSYNYSSRKEVLLEAIDEALEYLNNNKK